MAVTATLYHSFASDLAAGTYPITAADQKIALLGPSYTPDPAHNDWSDVSGFETTATGYTSGGTTLTIETPTINTATGLYVFEFADVTWASLTGDVRYAVVYRNSGSKPLMGWIDWGSTVTRNQAEFTVAFPNGLFQLQRTV